MLAPSSGGLILYQAYGNVYDMTGRKAYLFEDKQIPSVGVFSTWMAFGGNTRDLGSFGEETNEITDLHQYSPRSVVKMDDPNITMAEYIQLEEEKARRRSQEFNWETATYGKVMYFEDIDYLKDFENQFPAIVYNDALTSEAKVSSEPTVSAYPTIKIDFDFKISSSDSDDEDYTFIYDKN
ncbi:hypothetical protein Tco_1514577 [Tanacetum coccineum]